MVSERRPFPCRDEFYAGNSRTAESGISFRKPVRLFWSGTGKRIYKYGDPNQRLQYHQWLSVAKFNRQRYLDKYPSGYCINLYCRGCLNTNNLVSPWYNRCL